MAGRVRIHADHDPAKALYVYPERCPAQQEGEPPNCCLTVPVGGVMRICPLMYGSEGWIERGYARHLDVGSFQIDVELYPHDVHAMRVLCLAAPASDTPAGATLRKRK